MADAALPLKGRLAIVTGAARGLGVAMAVELASRGADVCITHVSESSTQAAQDVAARIRALPHKPAAYVCRSDVSDADAPGELIAFLARETGNGSTPEKLTIDILVNNAAVEVVKWLTENTADDFERIFNTNVRGPMLLAKAVAPHLPQRGGRIINISSVAARRGMPQSSLYCGTKGALEAMTRSWADELGKHGTTVNAVGPGPVQSDMLDRIPPEIIDLIKTQTPIEDRTGEPEEVARVVAFLAGDDASWITGQCLSASGGYLQL